MNQKKNHTSEAHKAMNHILHIRQAKTSDIQEIAALFYGTIQSINSKDYPQDEIDDWSSWYRDTDKWAEKVAAQYFLVATNEMKIVGFASITKDGYLDFMFIHKDFQGQGIAKRLLKEIEIKAIDQGNSAINSEVSITAKGFFENHGFTVTQKQLKKSRNKELINYRMTKSL